MFQIAPGTGGNVKILQIIPAPQGLQATFHEDTPEEGDDGVYTFPVVCLALVEDPHGDRDVIPMDMSQDGYITLINDHSASVELSFHPLATNLFGT